MGKTSSSPVENKLPVAESTCSKKTFCPAVSALQDREYSFSRNVVSSPLARIPEGSHPRPPALRDIPTTEIFNNVRVSKMQQASISLLPHSMDMYERNTINSSSFDWERMSIDRLLQCKGDTREEINLKALKAMHANKTDLKSWKTHGKITALMVAVLAEDLEFVKILVAEGHNVLEKSQNGETALTLAKNLPAKEIYNFLLQSIK